MICVGINHRYKAGLTCNKRKKTLLEYFAEKVLLIILIERTFFELKKYI